MNYEDKLILKELKIIKTKINKTYKNLRSVIFKNEQENLSKGKTDIMIQRIIDTSDLLNLPVCSGKDIKIGDDKAISNYVDKHDYIKARVYAKISQHVNTYSIYDVRKVERPKDIFALNPLPYQRILSLIRQATIGAKKQMVSLEDYIDKSSPIALPLFSVLKETGNDLGYTV